MLIARSGQLTVLLPMPLFLWAWLSAFSNAFAWHLTPPDSSKKMGLTRFQPFTINVICWTVPIAIFAVQIALISQWPIRQGIANRKADVLATLKLSRLPDDPYLKTAANAANTALRTAEIYYQAVWGIWAGAYGTCWIVRAATAAAFVRAS